MRTRDRNRRPKCLEPIRAAAVDFALKEKARSRTPTAKIAERMEIQRKHLTDVLCDLQRGDVDGTGLEYLFASSKPLTTTLSSRSSPAAQPLSRWRHEDPCTRPRHCRRRRLA